MKEIYFTTIKDDENKSKRPKNKTTGAVLEVRTAPAVWELDGPTITGPIISRIFIAPPINQKERPLCLIQNGPLFLALAKNTFFIKWFNIIYDC